MLYSLSKQTKMSIAHFSLSSAQPTLYFRVIYMIKISKKAKEAILLGGVCTIAYLAVYIARNVLSTVSTGMVSEGIFTKEFVGSLSSVYFIAYAIGQLINGIIGDRIKAKYMISFGLAFAGIANYAFSLVPATPFLSFLAYGACGFFLSMIYAPMTKVVADSTEPIYATRCGVAYTFSSFFGSPTAGILAAFFAWQGVFAISSIALILMSIACFAVFCSFERKGIVKNVPYKKPERKGGGIKLLIENQIIRYTLISLLTGIIRTTVVFWLPTYIAEYLKFSEKKSSLLFSASTLIISFTAFIALFVYEALKRNMNLSVLIFFIISAVMFALVYVTKQPMLNLIFIVLAIMASNSAASILWSMYCPSLTYTGLVSSATGFLDFISYMAAALSSTIFANAVDSIGWDNLILVWFGLMIIGVIVALPIDKIFKKNKV